MSPLAVTQEEACRLLSCGPSKLSELRQRGYLVPLWKGVYAVKDIEACVEKLLQEKPRKAVESKPKAEATNEGIPKEKRVVGSEGGRSGYRTPKELLWSE
jgi:hypothetical protein